MLSGLGWFSNVRSVLEIIYFVCTPFLVAGAFLALKQITTTWEINKVNSRRESMKEAALQCKLFKDEIMPKMRNLDSVIKTENIEFFNKSKVKIDGTHINIQACREISEIVKLEKHLELFWDIANDFDALALFFVTGIADEMIAFKAFGDIYCSFIKRYFAIFYPLFSSYDNNIESGSAMFDLFFLWNIRFDSFALKRKVVNLQNELKDVYNELYKNRRRSQPVPPFGC